MNNPKKADDIDALIEFYIGLVKKYPSIKYLEDPFKKDHLRAWVTLKTNMETGHGGASGRYEYYKEVALDYAFLLDQVGLV